MCRRSKTLTFSSDIFIGHFHALLSFVASGKEQTKMNTGRTSACIFPCVRKMRADTHLVYGSHFLPNVTQVLESLFAALHMRGVGQGQRQREDAAETETDHDRRFQNPEACGRQDGREGAREGGGLEAPENGGQALTQTGQEITDTRNVSTAAMVRG